MSPPKSGSGTGAGPATPAAGQQHGHGQHPLSVSSSGESDEEEDANRKPEDENTKRQDAKNAMDRDTLVKKIVDLLDNEEEEEVKDLLKPYMGDLAKVSRLNVSSMLRGLSKELVLKLPRTKSSWTKSAWTACIAEKVWR